MDGYTLKLKKNSGRCWEQFSAGYVKGYAFCDGVLLTGQSLIGALYDIFVNDAGICQALNRLNGSFSAVVKNGDDVFLVADKMRSHALLYAYQDSQPVISDDIEWMLAQMPKPSFDATAMSMFMSGGYIYGSQTIIRGCKVVAAGSYVKVDTCRITEVVYHDFMSEPAKAISELDVLDRAAGALEEAFVRMLESIGAKTIVIPLSGGYDSRLIACLCKKHRIQNVICYTYGRRDSFEVETSKRVAEQLGYPWYYVEYTEELLKSFYADDAYVKFTLDACALYHRQDFMAIKVLVEQGVITKNCVVVPGHTGDLLPKAYTSTRGCLLQKICDRHFYLNKLWRKDNCGLRQFLGTYVQENNGRWTTAIYQNFDISSRQANFIVNSTRVYEFFGLDWRIPLWDDAYAHLWLAYCPTPEEKKRALYDKFMFDYYFSQYGVDYHKRIGQGRIAKWMAVVKLTGNLKSVVKDVLIKYIPKFRRLYDFNCTMPAIRILQKKCSGYKSEYVRLIGQSEKGYALIWMEKLYREMMNR